DLATATNEPAGSTPNNALISINYGNGLGAFTAETRLSAARATNTTSGRRLISGDFDGDGVLDLAAVDGQSGVNVFYGLGHRTFAADFDGNGTIDLAVTSNSFTVQLFLANRNRTFQAGPTIARARATIAGDFNGDG